MTGPAPSLALSSSVSGTNERRHASSGRPPVLRAVRHSSRSMALVLAIRPTGDGIEPTRSALLCRLIHELVSVVSL